jgi:hypothetical protein
MYQTTSVPFRKLLYCIMLANGITVYTADYQSGVAPAATDVVIEHKRLHHLVYVVKQINKDYYDYFNTRYFTQNTAKPALKTTEALQKYRTENKSEYRILKRKDGTAFCICEYNNQNGLNNCLVISYTNNLLSKPFNQVFFFDFPKEQNINECIFLPRGAIITGNPDDGTFRETTVNNEGNLANYELRFKIGDRFLKCPTSTLVKITKDIPRHYIDNDTKQVAVVDCAQTPLLSGEEKEELPNIVLPASTLELYQKLLSTIFIAEEQYVAHLLLLHKLGYVESSLGKYLEPRLTTCYKPQGAGNYFMLNKYSGALNYTFDPRHYNKVLTLVPAESQENNTVNALVQHSTLTTEQGTGRRFNMLAFVDDQRKFIKNSTVAVYIDALKNPCAIIGWPLNGAEIPYAIPTINSYLPRARNEQLTKVALNNTGIVALLLSDFPFGNTLYGQSIYLVQPGNHEARLIHKINPQAGEYSLAEEQQIDTIQFGTKNTQDSVTLNCFYKPTTTYELLFPRFHKIPVDTTTVHVQ